MPMSLQMVELHSAHQVKRLEHEDKSFAELCYFLETRINTALREAPVISAQQLLEWMDEHSKYCEVRKCELKYKAFSL